MAYPIQLLWPEPKLIVIAPQQSGVANVPMKGNFPFVYSSFDITPYYTPTTVGNYTYGSTNGFSRSVALTSAGTGNAGVQFTITGIGASPVAPLSVTITGPAANSTVDTVSQFTVINSITCSGNYTNVTASIGSSGYVVIKLDTMRINCKTNVSIIPYSNGNINYSVFASNQLLEYPTSQGMILNPSFLAESIILNSAGTATGQAVTIPSYTFPVSNANRFVYDSPCTSIQILFSPFTLGAITDSAVITVIQQGLSS